MLPTSTVTTAPSPSRFDFVPSSLNPIQFSSAPSFSLKFERKTIGPENLVVSEFSYRPASPSSDEDPGGLYSRTDFEFIEFKNISGEAIHLDGVRLTDGIEFDFSEATHFGIAAGETLLLVENRTAFLARYPGVPAERIAGEYRGNLNNGGERIEILAADGSVIHSFTFGDRLPWPPAADGKGFTLELIAPATGSDHDIGWNRRASRGVHGTPAGIVSPMDFATSLQSSTDLSTWSQTGTEVLPSLANSDETITRKFRSSSPVGTIPLEFILLKFSN